MGICSCVAPHPNCSCRRNVIGLHFGRPSLTYIDEGANIREDSWEEIRRLLAPFQFRFHEPAPTPEPEPATVDDRYAKGYEAGYMAGRDQAHLTYKEGYQDGEYQGRLTGFEEGRIHATKHLQEVEDLREAAEDEEGVELCEGEVNLTDNPTGPGFFAVCDECDYVQEIDNEMCVLEMWEYLEELNAEAHPKCRLV